MEYHRHPVSFQLLQDEGGKGILAGRVAQDMWRGCLD